VITYDRRGYGDSYEAGPPVSLEQHVDDLLDVMGPVPISVVAHSFVALWRLRLRLPIPTDSPD
jgi:pimeloyl-ACP methyl ester carboxylesterase